MAKSNAVWGIDVGQCSLKAIRCALGSDGNHLVADAFDYIEYPKILTQPEADPVVLVREALELFLSRNDLGGDSVAISVPGQSGLARFIKLPPVESKKISAIVSYEAKQQIPFPLEDVIWDFQKMPGGSEEEGFALDTEVGLFAMKRDQVFRAIKPFETAGIELDVIQLSPLALYNSVVFDVLTNLPPPEEYDPANPPESLVLVSIGTDSTDLVVTNGYRVWQRSVPLGGNHFTKQLTKELKVTFAKAEHLKRNAREAKDPRAIFQAMRPIFRDIVTEVQRSIGFFQSIDRDAKISRVLAFGNAMKLPGLQQYLEKNLGFPVTVCDSFTKLQGTSVISSPSFKDNILSFPVCYGLAVQALAKSTIHTNLLPREILTRRMVRQKKPWAVITVALLLVGCLFNYFFHWSAWAKVREDHYKASMSKADSVYQESQRHIGTDTDNANSYEYLKSVGDAVVTTTDGRLIYAELLKAIYAAMPREENLAVGAISKLPLDERPSLYIEAIESEYFPMLVEWWTPDVEKLYLERRPDLQPADGEKNAGPAPAAAATPNPAASPGNPTAPSVYGSGGGETVLPAPEGSGWVIEIHGYHFHNKVGGLQGAQYVYEKFMKNLENGQIELPDGPNGDETIPVSMKELGIRYPVLLRDYSAMLKDSEVDNPEYDPEQSRNSLDPFSQNRNSDLFALDEEEEIPEKIPFDKYVFRIQFCWQGTPLSKRIEMRAKRALEQEKEDDEAAEEEVAHQNGGVGGL